MSKDLVQQQFGANAAAYATSAVHAKGASLARLVELVAPLGTWRALDVATGAGHTAAAFAPHVAEVVASDLTDEMLAEAAMLAAERGLANMTTTRADAEAMPFADQSFDLVTCRIAPHHFGSVAAFVGESWRVLKPGGVFGLVDNVSPDSATTPGHSAAALRDAAISYNAFEKLRDPSHGRALTTGEWLEIVDDTGFSIAHHELMAKTLELEAWCNTMNVQHHYTRLKLRAMLMEGSEALKAFLRPTRNGETLHFVLTEIVLVGRKPA
jgi:ubiquinone/menaquinone biosynthesis C-methylase UbiE